MRGVGGLLRLTQCLGMLWGQNIAQGYIPPSPTLAGLIAGLPLHRYYNNTSTTTSDSNVYNGQGVTRQACQTHSVPHSTTHHCNGNTTRTATTTSDDVMGVGRMCTSALLPSRAAEMTLYDASEGVPLLAMTPCDALDVQQALCLLTHRAHRRQAQQQQHTNITNSSGSSVCNNDDESGDGEDKYAARDTLAALLTTVQTHHTLLAGAESLQTGVPLRFTQAALASAMVYMAHALHTVSTTTTITGMKGSDTRITAATHVSLVDNDIATRDRAARILQQDCHTLLQQLVQQQQKSLGVHPSWPALCLSPTRFSLAYALQATTAALLTPGCRDVLWLPSADAALAALWLMHLLTHPTQQEHNSTSSNSYSDECDERKKMCKAEGWSAARRFHVLLTGSPNLHILPALTAALQVPLPRISIPSLVQQQSAQDSHACHFDTLPTRHDDSTVSHICATTTDTTTTTTTTLVSSAHMQSLLLLLYGFTPTAAQTLYTELHKKMQHTHDVTHTVPADYPALPVSCHCVTLQPAIPSIVICHTSRVARHAMCTQDDCTAHTEIENDEDEERKVCAAVARWLYRHAFTSCDDTVRTTATTAESEMNAREIVASQGAVTDEDVLQLQLSVLPAGHGVSCISLTIRAHQTCTTKGEEQTKKNEDERQARSHTTTTTSSHSPPPLLATVTSSSLRTPLAFIPRSQLRRVLREVVQLYAGGPSVGHISHSLDMECAIGPLRSAAHGEAVRRCLTAAVKGQPAGYEKEEVVVVRGRRSSDGAITTEQRDEGGMQKVNHIGSAALSSSSISPHTSPETSFSNPGSSSSTSSPRPESRHAAISSHTSATTTTTTNGRKMRMQPVRWQKVSGGFPLSMTAAGPTALYLAPCLLCTSLSALTVSPPSTQAETASTTSLCTNSSSGSSDGVEMNEVNDTEIHALTEAVHRVCHSVTRLTAELERDYDGTVPCVLFVCEYEDGSGPAVQRACEQYARTT